jgi:hypothetical protein
MNEGDTVVLQDGSQGVLLKMPRSEGRKSPRALVQTIHGENWVPVADLKTLENEKMEGQ